MVHFYNLVCTSVFFTNLTKALYFLIFNMYIIVYINLICVKSYLDFFSTCGSGKRVTENGIQISISSPVTDAE